MIKIENTEVFGWEPAIRGMRNPKNSWDKSDSYWTYIEDPQTLETAKYEFFIGENDLKLMKTLANAGSDHGKFLRMITVYFDITAPMYWYKEMDTYKVGTVRDSCSTMHKLASSPITINDISCEHMSESGKVSMTNLMAIIEAHRQKYLETNDKNEWYSMIQMLPSSYNQRSTVMMNYAVLRNIYHSRKNHKLDEWTKGFIPWIESLPYFNELIKGED